MLTAAALYFLILHTMDLGIVLTKDGIPASTRMTAFVLDTVAIVLAVMLLVLL